MVASHDDLKRHVLSVIDSLPDESLAEVATFLDFQQYKLGKQGSAAPPFRPVPLGGVWNGTRIDDDDIADARNEIWGRFRANEE